MKYKAVIFDLFGTLVDITPWTENTNILNRMASVLSVSADDFAASWRATFDERMKGIFNNYQACIGHVCQQLGVNAKDNQIESAARIRFDMTRLEVTTPREGAVEVLSHLKANGYKTGLISNCSTETTTIWKDSPFARLIDVTIFSCLTGTKKPDPRIYQMATEKLAVNPKECLYIADGMDGELASATGLGMHALMIRVPYENDYDHYREDWSGPVISSLKEVLALVR